MMSELEFLVWELSKGKEKYCNLTLSFLFVIPVFG